MCSDDAVVGPEAGHHLEEAEVQGPLTARHVTWQVPQLRESPSTEDNELFTKIENQKLI